MPGAEEAPLSAAAGSPPSAPLLGIGASLSSMLSGVDDTSMW
eukprot:CAMPEP_0185747264 /NCGR_PEP_ID=MMETSP1174-20130828/5871_1 /TAXON_ID=35687 /ORGANISM="Dictyocha speculum, Strain CCMP1381" /LENGTH=41 /DNA_ID= /DNA_START= /DNA_END= /DNA_ORIENTATION=